MTTPSYKDPPKIHTDFYNSEYMLSGLHNNFGIRTCWSMEDHPRMGKWKISGSGSVAGISLYFHPELFSEALPKPYKCGEDIDVVVTSVISHEAGHILCKHPQELNRDPNVLAMLDKGEGHKLPLADRELVYKTELEAWAVGDTVIMQCLLNDPSFDANWSDKLHSKFKAHCLNTYKKGLAL